MDTTIPHRDINLSNNGSIDISFDTSIVHGQRSSTEINKDSNLPSENEAYRAPVPLPMSRKGGPEAPHCTGHQGQGKPYGCIYQVDPDELHKEVEGGPLDSMMEWLEWDLRTMYRLGRVLEALNPGGVHHTRYIHYTGTPVCMNGMQ